MKLLYLIIMLGVLLIAAPSCHASWLIYHQPEFKGRIVDIENDQPIEGALVISFYHTDSINGPGGKLSKVIHAKEALTDKNGYFRISSYTTLIQPFSWSEGVTFIVFKPGYLCFGKTNLEDVFTGTETVDRELFPVWNKKLKYALMRSGTIKIPKVTAFEDRRESRFNFDAYDFKNSLPIYKIMNTNEDNYINELRGKEHENKK